MSGGVIKREVTIGGKSCLLGFSGRDYVQSAKFDATYLTPGGVNEVQTVTVTGGPTGGTFKLTYRGQTTAAIAFNATAAVVQTALRALSRIGSNGVDVTGSAGGPYTVSFKGSLASQNIEALVGDGALLTGGTTPGVTVAEATKGSSRHAGLFVIESGLVLAKTADGKGVKPYEALGNVNEVQTVTITGVPTGGTFALEFEGEQTAAIAFNATAAAVQTALEGLPNLDPGDILCAGGPLPSTAVTITFIGRRGGVSVQRVTAQAQALTGGTTPAASVAQTTQGAEAELIVGIFDGRREFYGNHAAASEEIPVYNNQCVFDKDMIQNFTTFEGALRRWGRENDCVFRSQGV